MSQHLVRVLATSHGTALVDTVPPRHVSFAAHTPVVCGDFVSIVDDRIAAVAARRSALVRARTDGHADTGAQVLAAHVDVVGICAALDRPLRTGFIERAVAVAHACPARPLLLLTKRDACADVDAAFAAAQEVAPAVDVLAVSAWDSDDVDAVRTMVAPGETLALLGASGAGKSTLANALAGVVVQAVGDVQADGRGRHTTTGARLLPLAHGAWLVDLAGVRALGLVADEDDVDAAFPDIEAHAAGCRFRDCAHEREPGCSVHAAIEAGQLSAARVSSWRKLRADAARRAAAGTSPALERKRRDKVLTLAGWQHARDKRPR